MSGHTTRLTTSPFRTTAGSYENPIEGIVDYGAFDRGFQKGIEPGVEALKEKKKKEEELDKIELDVSTEGITGVSKNVMTGGVDLKTNDLLELNAVEAMSRFRPQYISAKRNGNLQLQNRILRSIGNAKKSYSNLAAYVRNLGDPKTIDGNVSNTRFINENGEETSFDGVQFTDLNNNRSNQIRQGVKVNKNGVAKQGFYVLNEDGEQLFLNTQDMDSAWMATHFKVKNNLQADIGDSVSKDGVNELYNRTATYFTDTNATTTIRLSNGNTVTTKAGDGTKYIRPEFYEKAQAGAVKFAETEFKDENDPGFESAWNQLSNDESFTSFLDGKYISPEQRRTEFYTTKQKIAMLQDHAAERWKISVADQGYVVGRSIELTDEYIKANNPDLAASEDGIDFDGFREAAVKNGTAVEKDGKFILITNLGRGEKRNELQYNKTFTQTTKPSDPVEITPIEGSKGTKTGSVRGRLFNIASNLQESIYNVITPSTGDDSQFLDKDGYRDINIKQLTGGLAIDIDGTKATLESGQIVREGNNMFLDIALDTGRIGSGEGRVIDQQNRRFRVGGIKIVEGKETLVPDFAGRKRFTEAVYRGTYSDDKTIGTATDLLTGDRTIYNDRALVQEGFGRAGKDDTMFRRLNVIYNYKSNPKVFETLNDKDIKLLTGPAKSTYLGEAYQDFLAGQDFDDN